MPPLRTLAPSLRHLHLVPGQLRRSWYIFFQLLPGISERCLGRVIPKLWADWSPGYDARADVTDVFASLGGPGRRTAALRYYRAAFRSALHPRRSAGAASPARRRPSLLYLYGDQDGCLQPQLSARANHIQRPPSHATMVPGTGHFLHLEQPEMVNSLIAEFLDPPQQEQPRSRRP